MICEKCKASIPDTIKFCPKCGTKVEVKKNRDENTIICSQCGTSYPVNTKFCKKDGTLLQDISSIKKEDQKQKISDEKIETENVVEPISEPISEVINSEVKSTESNDIAKEKPEEKPIDKKEESEKLTYLLVCPKCGQEYPPTARFCKKDGDSLVKKMRPKIKPIDTKPEMEVKVNKHKKKFYTHLLARIFIYGFISVLVGAGSYFYFSGKMDNILDKINNGVKEITKVIQKNPIVEHAEETPAQPPDIPKPLPEPSPESPPEPIEFNKIEETINNELKNNNLVNVHSIVNNDLSVILVGKVNDIRDKMLAEHIAQQKFKEIKGIRNEISVEESTSMPAKSEPYVIDIYKLEDNINTELRDKGLKNVSAKVNNDLSVALLGRVNDPRDKILAENIVEEFGEAKEIKNEIQVETPVQKTTPKQSKISPSKHENDINRALRNGGVYDITAEFNKDLEIILRGSTTQHEKDKAMSIVKKFKNNKIIDMVFVKIDEQPRPIKKN